MSKTKRILLAGIPVLIAAAVTGSAMIYSQRNHNTQTGTDNHANVNIGNGNANGCVNLGDKGTVNCNSTPGQNTTPYRTDATPTGSGPWAFRVFNTVVDGTDVGLTVRTCPYQTCGCATAHCEKIGIARNDSLLLALCQLDSGFNGNDTTSLWLKIKWPSNRSGDQADYSSSAQDPYYGWVLKKYTTPAGHNGDIPACT
jgi:hypothetical protein